MSDNRGQDYVGMPPQGGGQQPTGERRVALVIGNGAYNGSVGPLRNPTNDAKDIAAVLASPQLGFKVTLHLDLGRAAMVRAISAFDDEADGAEVAIFYYAGHGAQADKKNILLPTDFEHDAGLKKSLLTYEIQSKGVGLEQILAATSKALRTVIFLDACRDDPTRGAGGNTGELRSVFGEGFGKVDLGAIQRNNTLISFSADSGQQALDGQGNNSPYTRALLDHIEDDLSITDLLTKVRGRVLQDTGNRQRPREDSTLASVFKIAVKSAARVQAGPAISLDLLSWSRAEWDRLEASTDIEKLRRFAERADPYYAHEARDRIAALEAQAQQAADAERARAEQEAKLRAEAASKRAEQEEITRRYAADWATAQRGGSVAAYEAFLAAWTGGTHEAEARQKLAALKAEASQREHADRAKQPIAVRIGSGANDKTVRLAPGQSIKDADFAPEMVLVPPGKFWMGSKDGEGDADERPRHEVTIGYPLLVGKYPVTFDEWDAFDRAEGIHETKETTSGLLFKKTETTKAKYTPGDEGWGRGKRPVINVSWHDAKAYVAWLSQVTGKQYRLLSEAEWEYACRAGSIGRWSCGDDESKLVGHAWYSANSGSKTQPVGGKAPNQFGLHDMHGNVREWCEDAWVDTYQGASADGSPRQSAVTSVSRVLRGGSWLNYPRDLRSADRFRYPPGGRGNVIGFRLARTLPPTP